MAPAARGTGMSLFAAIIAVLVVGGFLLGPGMVAETAALVDRLERLLAGQDIELDVTPAARALLACGYSAVCASRPYPWIASASPRSVRSIFRVWTIDECR